MGDEVPPPEPPMPIEMFYSDKNQLFYQLNNLNCPIHDFQIAILGMSGFESRTTTINATPPD